MEPFDSGLFQHNFKFVAVTSYESIVGEFGIAGGVFVETMEENGLCPASFDAQTRK